MHTLMLSNKSKSQNYLHIMIMTMYIYVLVRETYVPGVVLCIIDTKVRISGPLF